MWSSSAIPCISLFCNQQIHNVFSYSFQAPHIMLSNVCFYIVRSMFPFLFNWSQLKASVVNQMGHPFFEAEYYSFALFKFLKVIILTTFFQRWSTLWNSKLEKTTLLHCCLTLLASTFKQTTLIRYYSSL